MTTDKERLDQQTDWYQQRFNCLRQWVEKEVRPLSKEVARRYYAIVANGSPSPHESADWRETMHGLTLRAARAERERDEARAEVSRLAALLASDRQDAEERGAYWCLKAGARVIYSTVGNDAYWMLAREVCARARDARKDGR